MVTSPNPKTPTTRVTESGQIDGSPPMVATLNGSTAPTLDNSAADDDEYTEDDTAMNAERATAVTSEIYRGILNGGEEATWDDKGRGDKSNSDSLSLSARPRPAERSPPKKLRKKSKKDSTQKRSTSKEREKKEKKKERKTSPGHALCS